MASGGWPVMPSEVVLTSSPARLSRCGSAASLAGCTAGAEARLQRRRALRRAVDHVDLADAALDQAIDDGARRAAGAEHDRVAGALAPSPAPQRRDWR